MDGRALAARIRAELKDDVAELGDIGFATVLVGDDPASQVYIRLKHEAADEVGILVAAVGQPHLITADMVKQGSAVVDVGVTRTDAGLLGDVDPGVGAVAAFLTPVPGGVGPMTIALLLDNAVRAARYRRGAL